MVMPRSVIYQPLPLDSQPWYERAECREADPELFYPEKGGSTRPAKRVCAGCSVQIECRDYAIVNDERFGVWGGKSERELRRLKRTRAEQIALGGNVTRATNRKDWRADLTHCKQGHPYEGDNVREDPNTGHRICRTCQAEAKARHRQARRAS